MFGNVAFIYLKSFMYSDYNKIYNLKVYFMCLYTLPNTHAHIFHLPYFDYMQFVCIVLIIIWQKREVHKSQEDGSLCGKRQKTMVLQNINMRSYTAPKHTKHAPIFHSHTPAIILFFCMYVRRIVAYGMKCNLIKL